MLSFSLFFYNSSSSFYLSFYKVPTVCPVGYFGSPNCQRECYWTSNVFLVQRRLCCVYCCHCSSSFAFTVSKKSLLILYALGESFYKADLNFFLLPESHLLTYRQSRLLKRAPWSLTWFFAKLIVKNLWQRSVKEGLVYISTTKGQIMFVVLMKTEFAVYYDLV